MTTKLVFTMWETQMSVNALATRLFLETEELHKCIQWFHVVKNHSQFSFHCRSFRLWNLSIVNTLGTGEVSCIKWNLSIVNTWGPGEVSCIERCPHFRNLSIVNTLGPGKVSCIEWCPHFRGKFRKHIWDTAKCP